MGDLKILAGWFPVHKKGSVHVSVNAILTILYATVVTKFECRKQNIRDATPFLSRGYMPLCSCFTIQYLANFTMF